MKAIYDAVRNLLYPEHAEKRAGPALSLREYPWEVRFSLLDFERRNRGHRHQLSSVELSPSGCTVRGTPEHARREALSETSHALFTFLMQAPLRRLPNSPAVSAVLKARDNLGWLRRHTCQLLEHRCQEIMRELALPDYEMYYGHIEDAGEYYVLHLSVRLRGHQTLLSAIPQTRNGIVIQTSAERTARATLTSSTRTLLRSVTSAKDTHAGILSAVLDAPDNTDMLEQQARDILQWVYYEIPSVNPDINRSLPNYAIRRFEVQRTLEGIVVQVEVNSRSPYLTAYRTLQLPPCDCTTLRKTIQFLQDAKAYLHKELADLDSWPEFGQDVKHKAHLDRICRDLQKMVNGYSTDTRHVLVDNWQALCPITKA